MANSNITVTTTGKIRFIKSGFRRNYNTLNKIIEEWYCDLAADGNLCLAISRKAPRLLEWCRQEFGTPFGSLHVVSELALPFTDMSNYHNCTVVDEAIYNGTTFSKVLSIANCMGNSDYEVKAYPLVLTSEALENGSIMEKLVSTHKIEKRDVQFFVDAIISKFLTLGKSYDIEHPIFYIDLDGDIDEQRMGSILERLSMLESGKRNLSKDETFYYVTKTYSREKEQDYFSFTYLTDYLYKALPENVRPELSKLRFFVKGNRLSIVSMSPYAIKDAYLNLDVEKFTDKLEKIWRYIKGASTKTNPNIDNEEYVYQKQKSLVVLVNYLLSFAQFLHMKSSLEQVLSSESLSAFKVEESDLVYLLGESVGKQVALMLNEVLCLYPQSGISLYPMCQLDGSVVPYNYADVYRFQMNVDNLDQRIVTLSQMISNQFSAMHWYVELPSRIYEKKFNRLRFGESYSSLYKRYQAYFTSGADTIRKVNQAMDARIDRGSVVPNYVSRNIGESYWLRLFRSGENEDYDKDQLLRTIANIFQYYCRKREGNIMHTLELQLILGLIVKFGKVTADGNNALFGRRLSVAFEGRYRVLAHLEDSTEDLIDYAINNKVLVREADDFLRLADTTYAHELTLGINMSEEDEKILDSFVEYVNQLRKVDKELFDLREILNYLMYSTSKLEDQLQSYYSTLFKLLNSDALLDFPNLEAAFMQFYLRIPEPYLPIPEFGDNLETVGLDVSRVMQIVGKKLRTQKTLDKLFTAYYVLNVWCEISFGVSSTRISFEKLTNQLHYLSEENMSFSDGIKAFEWIRINDSYDRLRQLPKDALKSRLLELLSFIL